MFQVYPQSFPEILYDWEKQALVVDIFVTSCLKFKAFAAKIEKILVKII